MEAGAGLGQRVILKDPAHVVEQAGDRQHDGGWAEIVSRVPGRTEHTDFPGRRNGQTTLLLGPGLVEALPGQVQLTQHVLGVLVVRLRRFCEPIHRFGSILWSQIRR